MHALTIYFSDTILPNKDIAKMSLFTDPQLHSYAHSQLAIRYSTHTVIL